MAQAYESLTVAIPRKIYYDLIEGQGAVGIDIKISETIKSISSRQRRALNLLPLPPGKSFVEIELEIHTKTRTRIQKQARRFGLTENQLLLIAIQELAYPAGIFLQTMSDDMILEMLDVLA